MVCPERVGWYPQTQQEWGQWPSLTRPGYMHSSQEPWHLSRVRRAFNCLRASRPSHGSNQACVYLESHSADPSSQGRQSRRVGTEPLRYDWTLDEHTVSVFLCLISPLLRQLCSRFLSWDYTLTLPDWPLLSSNPLSCLPPRGTSSPLLTTYTKK